MCIYYYYCCYGMGWDVQGVGWDWMCAGCAHPGCSRAVPCRSPPRSPVPPRAPPASLPYPPHSPPRYLPGCSQHPHGSGGGGPAAAAPGRAGFSRSRNGGGGAVAGPPLGPPVPPQPRLDAAKVTPRRLQLPGGAGHRPPPGPGWMGGPGGPSDGRRQSSSLPGVLLLGRIFLFLHTGPGVSWPRNA